MSDQTAWSGDEADLPDTDRLYSLERQQQLVDRVIGLEARLVEVEGSSRLSPSETLAVEQRLIEMQGSLAWRLGRRLTAPGRVLARRRGR